MHTAGLAPLYYSLIPTGSVLIALMIALYIQPKGLMIASIQAFAAGFLLAVVASELLPKLHFSHHPFALSIAFLLGLLLMLLLARLSPNCCSAEESTEPLLPFITGFCIEFFVNGVIIVLSALAGHYSCMLVAISLATCCFVCGLTITTRFIAVGYSQRKTTFNVGLMSLLFPVGGLLGLWFLYRVSTMWIECLIAVGLSVLLYIATVDLLPVGFKTKRLLPKVLFFIGFLTILLIGCHVAA